jgi:hypothetical protein
LTEYRFIKASYESFIDWCSHIDYLRCSPLFHGRPRYDCVLVNDEPRKDLFACLLFIFTYTLKASENVIINDGHDSITIPFAVVQPFAEASLRKRDHELCFIRLKEKPPSESLIIPAHSICRGAYIVPEDTTQHTSIVVDVIDDDMFLRMLAMYPPSYM